VLQVRIATSKKSPVCQHKERIGMSDDTKLCKGKKKPGNIIRRTIDIYLKAEICKCLIAFIWPSCIWICIGHSNLATNSSTIFTSQEGVSKYNS